MSHNEVRSPETETETDTNTPKRAVADHQDPVDNLRGVDGEFLAAVWRAYAYDVAQPGPDVRDTDAWRAQARIEAKRRWHTNAVALAHACPDATADQIARALAASLTANQLEANVELSKVAAAARAGEARAHRSVIAARALPSFDGTHRAGIADARKHLERTQP